MALPTTIPLSPAPRNVQGHVGPFKSSGGNFYVVACTSLGNLGAFKATDPTDSWTEQDTGNVPTPGGDMVTLSAVQDGDQIYVAWGRSPLVTSTNYGYSKFDMATDAWLVVLGGSSRTQSVIQTIDILLANRGDREWCHIAVTDDDVIFSYNGATDKVMGTEQFRADFARRGSKTGTSVWTSIDQAIDAGGDIDYGSPTCVVADNGLDLHFVWKANSNVASDPAIGFGDVQQARTLRDDNTLSTTVGSVDNDASSDIALKSNGNSLIDYDDGGTERILHIGTGIGSRTDTDVLSAVFGVDGSDDAALDAERAVTLSPTVRANSTTFYGEISAAIDSSGVIHAIYAGASAGDDAYYTNSDDDGVTWLTPVEEIDAITFTNPSVNIYDRSGPKLAYTYFDGTDLKYNEVDIAAGGPITADGDATLAAVDAAGVATRGVQASDGTPVLAVVDAAGVATKGVQASDGAPALAPVEAAGTASKGKEADGAATLAAIEAAGTAEKRVQADDGSPALVPVEGAGVATRGVQASDGAPTLTVVEGAGVATRGVQADDGAPTLTVVEAAGAASIGGADVTADGDATLTPVEAAGTAERRVQADDGAPTLVLVEAAGTAERRLQASDGTPSIAPVEAAGVAEVHITANGAASIAAILAAGAATVRRQASGAATLGAIEAAGVAVVPVPVFETGRRNITPFFN